MKWIKRAITFTFIFMPFTAKADHLTKEQVISIAEEFVITNGYTDAPADKIKADLNLESIERASDRDAILKFRFNTLKPRAINVKKFAKNRES